MRLHISLDDALVAQLDRRVGTRRRSAFVAETVRRALDEERRWDDIEAGLNSIAVSGHDWDGDPSGWVHAQRHADQRRVG
jgi:metal-responsive CopG/Arc/MetJ family transcriptional regulator